MGTAVARAVIDLALDAELLVPAFQPIVELQSGDVVGYEALARWEAPGLGPGTAFDAARAAGRLAELDWACRLAALRAALDADLGAGHSLFVNVEPETLGAPPPPAARAVLDEAARRLRVVVEFTERALTHRPADLLRVIDRVRGMGWGVALDDVGAAPESLALLPFVAPDVIKLDLSLVQRRPSVEQGHILAAVMAHAERTGASVLAEGVETGAHRDQAFALGATYGQGWYFGRPARLGTPGAASERVPFIRPPGIPPRTPFDLVVRSSRLRRGRKAVLLAMSRHLEELGLNHGTPRVVLGAFQTADRFTAASAARYAKLADVSPLVAAFGAGLGTEPAPGVHGAALDAADPLVGEWTVVVVGATYAGALIARDVGDHGPDLDRRYDFVVTHDRDTVLSAARSLLTRIAPSVTTVAGAPSGPAGITSPASAPPRSPRFPSRDGS